MKKIILALILMPTLLFAGQYKVIRVIDGDTIDILYHGEKERIRMLCVDTPESVHPDNSKNTPMGKRASDYAKYRLQDKSVDLEFESKKRGKYGRLLAYVILDGQNFNVHLVKEGWSPYYTKYGNSEKHHTEFLEAERKAQLSKINIWSSPSAPSEPTKQVYTWTIYHGNKNSHVFHAPHCRYYNCKSCTKVFKDRHKALAAGYRPCKICRP